MALGYGVWHGTRVDILTIKSVEVAAGETIDSKKIKSIAEAKLQGEYFKLVPRRFAWTYPQEEIESALKEVERVDEVTMSVENGEVLHISFTEYSPSALWCQNESDQCLFLDDSGYAFAEAPNLSGSSLIRFIKLNSELQVGDEPFSREFVSEALALIEYMKENSDFVAVKVEEVAEDELYIHFQGDSFIKVSLRQPLSETLENFEAVVASNDFSHLRPGNFEYIDLRYGNKIFVKEESTPLAKEETATTSVAAELVE